METVSMDILIYLVGLAATWGGVMFRISSLEKKMDKHNNLLERMAVAEQDIKICHKRLDQVDYMHRQKIGRKENEQ